jgi:hypothetical protein
MELKKKLLETFFNLQISGEWFSILQLGHRFEIFGRPTFSQPSKISATPLIECLNLKKVSSPTSR